MQRAQYTSHPGWRWARLGVACILGLLMISSLMAGYPSARASISTVGYVDFSYGTTGNSKPTGEKPESKLWWNDGYWWGSLYNDTAQAYHIYRLDLSSRAWVDTGMELDDRNSSKADALWDDATQKLYIASHIFNSTGVATTDSTLWGRLYRYSYNDGANTYSLDTGFPVNVTRGKSETLVVDKDSTGQLWVTYVESNKVKVNHSLGSDTLWGTPYTLPLAGASNTSSDDIASLIAYAGQIGVMWSNQSDKKMYFATHLDGAPDNQWQSTSAYSPPGNGADDHINLKSLQTDGAGHVFAVTKTSFTTASDPIIVLLVCTISSGCGSLSSDWQAHTVNTVSEGGTRPILLIDTTNHQLNVFYTESESGGTIRRKVSDSNNIQFPGGTGEPFIQNSTYYYMNNPTSTKQNVNSATGLVVLASHASSHYYLHNYISLSSTPATSTPTASGTNTPTPTAPATATPSSTPTNTPTPGSGGTLSVAPVADAHVKSAYPTSNYGSVTNLRLYNPGSEVINGYLKFNVSGVSGAVQRATLRLYAYDGSDVGGSIYAVANNYLNTTTPWTESGLTWTTAPALSGAPLRTIGAVASGTWVEFDVTTAVHGDGVYSFGLHSTSGNSVFYNSKEATTNPPVLIIESS